MERLLRPNNAIDYKTTPLKKLHMQVYQFTNGQETYLVEARNIYTKHLREIVKLWETHSGSKGLKIGITKQKR